MSNSNAFSNLPNFLGQIQRAKMKAKGSSGIDLARIEMERKNILDLNILVGVDCSGSISPTMFKDFMHQLDMVKGMSRIKVIEVASEIRAIYDFTRRGSKVIRLQGGGGNGEHLFFPIAERMKPDAIIYMTDGYCTEAKNPKIPTAWILTANGIKPYNWGEVAGKLPN